jgi:hypothetical protein
MAESRCCLITYRSKSVLLPIQFPTVDSKGWRHMQGRSDCKHVTHSTVARGAWKLGIPVINKTKEEKTRRSVKCHVCSLSHSSAASERTIPTERPPPVSEVIANFLRIEGATWSAWRIPTDYSRFSRQEPLLFYQVAPQLYSRGWVDPVPDQLLFFLVVPGIEPGPPDL